MSPGRNSARRSWRTLFPTSDDAPAPTPPSSPPPALMKLPQSQSASNSTNLPPSPQLNKKSPVDGMDEGKPSQQARAGDPSPGIANSSSSNDGVQEEEEEEEEEEEASANDGVQEEEEEEQASANDGVQEEEEEEKKASASDGLQELKASANDGVLEEKEKALKTDLSPSAAAGEKKKARLAMAKGKGAAVRVWSVEDEFRILECLAAFVKEHGAPPARAQLIDVVAGHVLDKKEFTLTEIYEKVRRLRDRYYGMRTTAAAGAPPRGDAEDLQKYELSRDIWGDSLLLPKRERKENGLDEAPKTHVRREFKELQHMYPHLTLAVEEISTGDRGCLRRAFEFIDDGKARELDAKVKKQRISEIKAQRDRSSMQRAVLSMLIEYME